ncbi:MAG: hypothetical protein ACRCU2_14055 [Planktothrix sp.]
MDNIEVRKNHFAALMEKYRVSPNSWDVPDLLYLILRKAELSIPLADLEWSWLADNNLFDTIKMIQIQEYQADEQARLVNEFLHLRNKYRIPSHLEIALSSPIYSLFLKVENGENLGDSEIKIIEYQGCLETVDFIENIQNFRELAIKHEAGSYINNFSDTLYSILKKLDTREDLNDLEANWLSDSNLDNTLQIYFKQEEERKAELEFVDLKDKYQVLNYLENCISSPLFLILKKFEKEEELEEAECQWLEQHKLMNLLEIDEKRKTTRNFAELKRQYKATDYQDSDPSSHLYEILLKLKSIEKIQISNNNLLEEDINWLKECGLEETVEIAKEHHFAFLKNKYRIVDPRLPITPFYEIMLKIEREERLDPKQVVQLIEEGHLSRHGTIAIAHYRLEAIFYDKEYKRTGNKWNLTTASSNWRKANNPEKALEVTNQINWNTIREPDLKSALLVTRGAAFRTLNKLNEAVDCATQAKECQPESHQPYTLLGAICYDLREYAKGDQWFEMAAERGANDTDDEIERIVRMTKDKKKRKEVAEYLLQKDAVRYAWAKSYLKE